MPPASITDHMPNEVLELIVRFANLNGDLCSTRQINSRFNTIAIEASKALPADPRQYHYITPRALDIFLTHSKPRPSSTDPPTRSTLQPVLRFNHTLHAIAQLIPNRKRSPLSSHSSPFPISSFLHLSALSATLSTLSTTTTLQEMDVLSPSPTLEATLPTLLAPTIHTFISTLTLPELNSLITAINVTVTKIWSQVFICTYSSQRNMHTARPSSADILAALSGAKVNMDQAVLTELVIWRGPLWAVRVLSDGDQGEVGGLLDANEDELRLWRGSQSDKARLVANGMGRWLWKVWERKVQEEEESRGTVVEDAGNEVGV